MKEKQNIEIINNRLDYIEDEIDRLKETLISFIEKIDKELSDINGC